MLHVVNDREFMVLVLGKTEVVNARRDYAIPVNMALSSYWVSHLDPYS